MLAVVAILVVIDIVSGIVDAAMHNAISSSKMREGLYHKSTYAIVLATAWAIEWAEMYADLGFEAPLLAPACVYIAINELFSIVENVGEINPELKGSKLLALFESARQKDSEDGNG